MAMASASAQTVGNSAIKGIVYNDTNKDGIHQLNESGIQGLSVELHAADGSLVSTLITDHNGYFNFTGLAAGQYTVYVVIPQGYTNSSANNVAINLQDNSLGKTCIGIYVVSKPPCRDQCNKDFNGCGKGCNNFNNSWSFDKNNGWNNKWGNFGCNKGCSQGGRGGQGH